MLFRSNDTATTEIYTLSDTLSLHDALPIWCAAAALNDHQLDTPGYRPRAGYRPATGTGVAPDIRLPVRRHYKRKGA